MSTLSLCIGWAYFANSWSDTTVLLSFSTEAFQTAVTVARKVIKVTKPYQSMISVFLLLFEYVLLVGLLQLFVTIWKNKKAGVVVALCLHIFGYLLTPDRFMAWMDLDESYRHVANLLAAWFSPLQQATYMMHNFGYDKLPRLRVSYLLLGGLGIVFAVLAYVRMGKLNFQFGKGGLYGE